MYSGKCCVSGRFFTTFFYNAGNLITSSFFLMKAKTILHSLMLKIATLNRNEYENHEFYYKRRK